MESTAQQSRWAREYETIYILRSAVEPDEAERVAQRVDEIVNRLSGKLVKVDNWGKRKLAYPIQRNSRGVFVYLRYLGMGDLVMELERNLRMLDSVIRYQTVKLRERVDVAEVQVDPEEVKFLRIEMSEEDDEPNIEERLGMVSRAPRPEPEPYEDEESAAPEPEAAPSEG